MLARRAPHDHARPQPLVEQVAPEDPQASRQGARRRRLGAPARLSARAGAWCTALGALLAESTESAEEPPRLTGVGTVERSLGGDRQHMSRHLGGFGLESKTKFTVSVHYSLSKVYIQCVKTVAV